MTKDISVSVNLHKYMAMTVEQFAQSIKAKYPAYANIPDAELVQKVVEKYPVYKDQVDFDVSEPEPMGLVDKFKETQKGVLKGAASTIKQGTNLFERGANSLLKTVLPKSLESKFGLDKAATPLLGGKGQTSLNKELPKLEEGIGLQAGDLTEARNPYQKFGKGLEQIAEFFVPGLASSKIGVAAKAATGLKGLAGVAVKAGAGGVAQGVLSGTNAALQEGDINKRVGQTAAIAGIATGVLDFVGGIGGLITNGRKLSPFASKVDTGVVNAAKRTGIDLPASALSKSRAVPLIETTMSKGIWGQSITDKVDDAFVKMNNIADDLVRGTGGATGKTEIGMNLVNGLDDYRTQFMSAKNALYSKAALPVGGKEILVNTDESLSFLRAILQDKEAAAKVLGSADDLALFKQVESALAKNSTGFLDDVVKLTTSTNAVQGQKIFERGNILTEQYAQQVIDGIVKSSQQRIGAEAAKQLADDLLQTVNPAKTTLIEIRKAAMDLVPTDQTSAKMLQSALKQVNEWADWNGKAVVSTGSKGVFKKLATLMSNEMDEAIKTQNPRLFGDIQKANEFYANGIELLNSKFGMTINNLREVPDQIIETLVSPKTSVHDIPRLFELVGKGNIDDVQAGLLQKIFSKARPNGKFTATGLSRELNAFGADKLKAIFSPKQVQVLGDLSTISSALAKGESVAKGSQTAFISRLMIELGGLFVNPVAAVKALLGDAVLSKAITSPLGQQFLTTGLPLNIGIEKVSNILAPILGEAFAGIFKENNK